MQAVKTGTRILPSIVRGVKLATNSVYLHAFSNEKCAFRKKIVLSEMVTNDSVQNTPQPPQVRGIPHFHCRFIFPPVNVLPSVMRYRYVVDDFGGLLVVLSGDFLQLQPIPPPSIMRNVVDDKHDNELVG